MEIHGVSGILSTQVLCFGSQIQTETKETTIENNNIKTNVERKLQKNE